MTIAGKPTMNESMYLLCKITVGDFPASHVSHERNPLTFHYWLFNRDPYNFIIVYYNPHIIGYYNPLYAVNSQVVFHCSC